MTAAQPPLSIREIVSQYDNLYNETQTMPAGIARPGKTIEMRLTWPSFAPLDDQMQSFRDQMRAWARQQTSHDLLNNCNYLERHWNEAPPGMAGPNGASLSIFTDEFRSRGIERSSIVQHSLGSHQEDEVPLGLRAQRMYYGRSY
ncbi:hypothetical protein JCM10449v2_007483 [Rhodotorula kratochvilovae]